MIKNGACLTFGSLWWAKPLLVGVLSYHVWPVNAENSAGAGML